MDTSLDDAVFGLNGRAHNGKFRKDIVEGYSDCEFEEPVDSFDSGFTFDQVSPQVDPYVPQVTSHVH